MKNEWFKRSPPTRQLNVIIWIRIISFHVWLYVDIFFNISEYFHLFSGQSSLLYCYYVQSINWMLLCLATSTGTIKNIVCCMNYVHKVYIKLFLAHNVSILHLTLEEKESEFTVHNVTCSGSQSTWFLSISVHFITTNGAGISNLLNLQPIILSYLYAGLLRLWWWLNMILLHFLFIFIASHSSFAHLIRNFGSFHWIFL